MEEAEADEEKEEEEERDEEDEDVHKWHPRLLNTLITLRSVDRFGSLQRLFLTFPVSSHGQGF